jgi:phage terminase small subunit
MVTTPGRKSSDALAAPSFGPERVRPPPDLDPKARAIFVEIIAAARPEHFQPVDSALLCAYCRAAAIEREAAAAIMAQPAAAPALLETYKAAATVMRTLAVRLRIGPQSRSGHTNPRMRKAEPTSYYDRMRLEQGNAKS